MPIDQQAYDSAARAVHALRGRGERVTRARRAVLEVLAGTAEHLSAEQIAERVGAAHADVHRATVYRSLETMCRLGLVSHIHLGHGAAAYHLGPDADGDRHLHAQCTGCGAVLDVDPDLLASAKQALESRYGFDLQDDHAALLGRCARCQS